MKKNTLLRRLITIFVLMALVMIIAISTILYFENRNETMEQYTDLALSYAKSGAEYIDGDRISEYIETGVTDDYYDDIQKFLNRELANSDLQYYYVIVPYENDFVYVWAGTDDINDIWLGVRDNYEGYVTDTIKSAFSKDPQINVTSGDTELYGSLVSLSYPIYDSTGEPAALVCVDLATPDIIRSIYKALFTAIIFMIPIILIIILIAFLYLRRRLIEPIILMNETARDMVEDIDKNKDVVIPVNTGDELEDLAHSLERMSRELRAYIDRLSKATAENERVETELSVAARIQSDLLPNIFPAFPDREEFDLAAATIPAKEVGGDFYDFFMVDNDHLALVIADVSDKGVPSAMFMVIAQTLIKNAIQSGLSPKDALFKVNNQLNESNNTGMFVTTWLAVLTISDGTLICSNAGHEYPIIGKRGEKFIILHDRHAFVLAGLRDVEYYEYEISLSVGDTIFVYTDGAAEAVNSKNEQFGTDRILAALNKEEKGTCKDQITEVFREIEKFEDGSPQYDDITMLSLKIKMKERAISITKVTLDKQPELTEFVESTFASWQIPHEMIVKMNIALDEIYSNIANYSGAGLVKITCGIGEDEITLTFEDDGAAFDPTKTRDVDITQTAEERSIGGLGLFIVKNSMDRMDYRYADGKNILTLRLKL